MRHILLYPFLISTVYSFAQIPDTTLRDTSQVIQFSITADDLESDAQNQDISTWGWRLY